MKHQSLSEVLGIHPDDLPYAHLLYRPDDDEIDPERPRIAEFVNTVYTERRVGTRYPIYAEGEGEMRPMPQVLAEAAGWYQHELKVLIDRFAVIAWPDLVEATRDLLIDPPSDRAPSYPLGNSSDPLDSLALQARKLPEDFDIQALANSLQPIFQPADMKPLDLKRLLEDIEDLRGRPAYQLYVRAVRLMKDRWLKRISDIDAERERQAIEKELGKLRPELKAAKPKKPSRGN